MVSHEAVDYGDDIFTEPDADPDTLANLGPLRGMAGRWQGTGGVDDHPSAEGVGRDAYIEVYDLQPIDPQTNGPQLFYGLRYHTHIVKPGEVETFHDQVGYWLWEPAAGLVTMTLGIPRGQVALASGSAAADATSFEVQAGASAIVSNPFLERAFRTVAFRMQITVGADEWSYEQETAMEISGQAAPFRHVDRNTVRRIAAPTPNPLAAAR